MTKAKEEKEKSLQRYLNILYIYSNIHQINFIFLVKKVKLVTKNFLLVSLQKTKFWLHSKNRNFWNKTLKKDNVFGSKKSVTGPKNFVFWTGSISKKKFPFFENKTSFF